MKRGITWIHPSYRDLVIEELTFNRDLRTRFLENMSVEGVQLALSDAGGETGNRSLPFMTDNESWNLLRQRCENIAQKSHSWDVKRLLTVLAEAVSQYTIENVKLNVAKTSATVCEALSQRWYEEKKVIDSNELLLYSKVSLATEPLIRLPYLTYSWQIHTSNFRDCLKESTEQGYIEDTYKIDEWVEFAISIQKTEPRFLEKVNFPDNFQREIETFIDIVEDEFYAELSTDNYDLLIAEAERFDSLSKSLDLIAGLYPDLRIKLSSLARRASEKEEELRREAYQLEPPALINEDDYHERSSSRDEFDIDALFDDL